ncbi:DinB family protein [Psychrobacillus sp. BL-248-WT-3]|uniref:DinB family protein n=1 Tax=Psychrobacillus sp. BL-248-WT-3 TaxID=2725306 RepID=UPI00146EEA9A|nr:DinB family protein [Psychrobacillus sp. BL-248-WT-3]NME05449.1 DinB family protein [Psychrobacillus sp. BL-248-WT-3]
MFLEKNNTIRAELFRLVDSLSEEEFNQKPDQNSWSPKEIMEHLVKMENTIVKGIKSELADPNSPHAKKKPIQVSTLRLIKVKAPKYTVPKPDYETKEVMKSQLHAARMELLKVYANNDYQVFQDKSLKHPLFGRVPLVQWFPFVGLHEKRHLKQLEKTIKKIKGHKN